MEIKLELYEGSYIVDITLDDTEYTIGKNDVYYYGNLSSIAKDYLKFKTGIKASKIDLEVEPIELDYGEIVISLYFKILINS